MPENVKVVIIGAGVIGMSTAVRIVGGAYDLTDTLARCSLDGDAKGAEPKEGVVTVDLIADSLSPNTTSDQAAGLCLVTELNDTDPKLISKWLASTIDHLQAIFQSEDAKDAGVSVSSTYLMINKPIELPDKNIVNSFLSCHELKEHQYPLKGSGFSSAISLTTMMAECKKYLPWMQERFLKNKVNFINKKVTNIEELYEDYDIIINCTGIGANELLKDNEVYPGRGQILKVEAPWIKHAYLDDFTYVIPGIDYVTVGGTMQRDNWSLKLDDADREDIWKRCCTLVPSLKKGKIIGQGVGLRPCRSSVRLTSDIVQVKDTDRQVTVIHNYGHGEGGVSLSWGCAEDAYLLYAQAVDRLRNA